MNVDLVLREVDLSPLAESHVGSRMEKLLQRTGRETPARVTLSGVRNTFSAQIHFVSDGQDVTGAAESRDNVLTAFDEALAKADRQLTRRAERVRKDHGPRSEGEALRAGRLYPRW